MAFIKTIHSQFSNDFQRLDALLEDRLVTEIGLTREIVRYFLAHKGKRLRPVLLFMVAQACQYQGPHHVTLAAVIELIHAATLLHDDVVDTSATRRGQPSANALYGNQASVLVGDYLYSRSFELMVEVENLEVIALLSQVTNRISQGELRQLDLAQKQSVTELEILSVIEEKTAVLFAAAAQLPAMLAKRPAHIIEAFAQFGHAVGMAFQLRDDILDYFGNSTQLGKDCGDDFFEKKWTYPIVKTLHVANDSEKNLLLEAMEEGSQAGFLRAQQLMRQLQIPALCENYLEQLLDSAQKILAEQDCVHDLEQFSALLHFLSMRSC